MVGRWLPRARRGGLAEGSVHGRRRLLFLSNLAAAPAAQVSALRPLAGDAASLVVHGGAAVEVLTNLDPSPSVGAALWSRRDRDGSAFQRDDVVGADGAP